MKAVMYCRCNCKREDDEHLLKSREMKLRKYADENDIEIVAVVYDTENGTDLKREGLQKAVRLAMECHADAILMSDLSQITRSVFDNDDFVKFFEGLTRKNLVIHCAEYGLTFKKIKDILGEKVLP